MSGNEDGRVTQLDVIGYVVMPEHVHLLLSEAGYRHYALGEAGAAQIESPVAAWTRRQIGKNSALKLLEN